MGPDIDGTCLAGANAQLPRDDATEVLPQVLVTDDAVVFNAEVIKSDATEHKILRRPGPGIDNGHLTRLGLADDQVVN